ncbi:MAG TPA: hypothetical protein DCE41_33695 [Cytophagales bacterium]|nr:hypothetical protein [Cytophagales bacterium]HAA18674.1 hypothetical protein [Cytophagales bacterium]HAP60090.1 hypothetical protein [Cytophagales bacterium]
METLTLKDGSISFDQDRILIQDKNKRQTQMRIISSSLWFIFGVLFILRYTSGEENFYLWSGLFIALGHATVLIIQLLFRTTRGEIQFSEIEKMSIKEKGNNTFFELKLKNRKLRRINQVEGIVEELNRHISTFTPLP